MTYLNKRREWPEIREMVASEYSRAATELPKILHWINMTAWWLHLATTFRYDDLRAAGIFASYKAIKEGEVSSSGDISDGAKRYIRREMLREAAPAWRPYYQQLIDYGYNDGRTLRQQETSTANNKYVHYHHRNRAKGLCPRCGKKPETELVLCNHCRLVKRRSYQRQAEKEGTGTIGMRMSQRKKHLAALRQLS